jgi:hypothetical protein
MTHALARAFAYRFRVSRTGPIGAALAFALVVSPAASARAAACCGSGHGVGQWLGASERAAASVAVRASDRFGSWTSERDFKLSPSGDYDRELGAEVGWMARAGRRLQLGVSVPMLATFRRLGDTESSGGGAGDVRAAARLEVLESGAAAWAPSVALTLGATLPTGRSSSASGDALGADVTGLGAGELRPGLGIEKAWRGFQATFAASVGFRTPFYTASGEEVRLAPRLQLLAAAGPTWGSGVSLALGGTYEREAGATFGGRVSPGTTRERAALLAVLAYDINARWTAIGSLQADIPIAGLGRNEIAAVAPSAGVRYVWGM